MITRTTELDLANRPYVLFDFDGTLADTKPGIVRTATTVLLDWGIPEDVVSAHVEELIGPPFPDAFTQVFGLSALDAVEVTERYRAIYYTLDRSAWPFFPGVQTALLRLSQAGRVLAIASSKKGDLVHRCVADNDATGLFAAIVGQHGNVRTKSQAIDRALHNLKVDADHTVMVGDRFHDVEGAASFGIPCIGVLWGNTGTRKELADAGATAVVDTVDELISVLLGTEAQ